MKLEIAEQIVDYINEHNLAEKGEIELYESYSGRRMFGDKTTGITLTRPYMQGLIGYAAARLGIDADELPHRIDNLGLSMIVY